MTFISSLVAKRGKGWLCFLPLDLSGIERSDELIADGIKDLSIFNKVDLQNAIDEVKNSLTSLSINYEATDCFINNSEIPSFLPNTDTERSSFGYALFWMAKRDRKVTLPFKVDEIVTSIYAGELQPSADAIRGLFEHPALEESYLAAVDIFVERLIREMQVPVFSGVLSPAVYSIPFYKLLDTEESRIAKPMYPCEIEPVLIEKMNATNSLKLWIESMKKLGEMKLYIQRYQQIVQTSIDEKCLCSMTAYTEMLIDQINTLWNDFILVEDLVSELIENANEQNSELLNVVKLFFNCYEELETVISTQNDPSELIQIIETVSIIMFLLLPSVS